MGVGSAQPVRNRCWNRLTKPAGLQRQGHWAWPWSWPGIYESAHLSWSLPMQSSSCSGSPRKTDKLRQGDGYGGKFMCVGFWNHQKSKIKKPTQWLPVAPSRLRPVGESSRAAWRTLKVSQWRYCSDGTVQGAELSEEPPRGCPAPSEPP